MNIVHSNLYSVVFISWKSFMFARGGDCVTKSVTFDLINCVQTVFNAVVLFRFCLFTNGLGYFAQVILYVGCCKFVIVVT